MIFNCKFTTTRQIKLKRKSPFGEKYLRFAVSMYGYAIFWKLPELLDCDALFCVHCIMKYCFVSAADDDCFISRGGQDAATDSPYKCADDMSLTALNRRTRPQKHCLIRNCVNNMVTKAFTALTLAKWPINEISIKAKADENASVRWVLLRQNEASIDII